MLQSFSVSLSIGFEGRCMEVRAGATRIRSLHGKAVISGYGSLFGVLWRSFNGFWNQKSQMLGT